MNYWERFDQIPRRFWVQSQNRELKLHHGWFQTYFRMSAGQFSRTLTAAHLSGLSSNKLTSTTNRLLFLLHGAERHRLWACQLFLLLLLWKVTRCQFRTAVMIGWCVAQKFGKIDLNLKKTEGLLFGSMVFLEFLDVCSKNIYFLEPSA